MNLYDVFLWLFLFKILLVILVSVKFRMDAKQRRLAKHTPDISILVPAFNEDICLTKTLDSIISNPYFVNTNSEIIVLDDGSTDSTALICAEYSAKNKRVFGVLKDNSGKADTLNQGIEFSKHEIILCVDADSTLSRDSILNGVRYFLDEKIGAVSGVAYPSRVKSLLEVSQYLEYSFGQEVEKQMQSAVNCILVIPGAIGFFRKSAVLGIGGYKTDTLTEDFDLTLELQVNDWKVTLDNSCVSYTEVPNNLSDLFKQRVRWMSGNFQTLLKYKKYFLNGTVLGSVMLPYSLVLGVLLAFFAPIFMMLFLFLNPVVFLLWCVSEIIFQIYAKRDGFFYLAPIQRLFQMFFNFYVVWVALFKFRKNHTWDKLKRTGV